MMPLLFHVDKGFILKKIKLDFVSNWFFNTILIQATDFDINLWHTAHLVCVDLKSLWCSAGICFELILSWSFIYFEIYLKFLFSMKIILLLYHSRYGITVRPIERYLKNCPWLNYFRTFRQRHFVRNIPRNL